MEQASGWPQIKEMKLILCPHIQINAQNFRGERWFVLRDTANGRLLRFNSGAYEVIGRLDGHKTLQQIYSQMAVVLGAEALTQEEVLHLIAQLFSIDALKGKLPVSVETMLARDAKTRNDRWQQKLLNPLALRFSLFDPDKFLNASISWLRPLFSKTGLLIWFCFVSIGAILALINSTQLIQAMSNDIMAMENLLLLWLLYPLIKACHEFAHAYAVKLWGGEVHEMGITLLIFMPVPYVDASAAWTFIERRKRVLVGAAGIMAELFLAALGLFVWLIVEPGLISQAGLFTFMTGAISTVIFNANPLLRFDGYFILQDLLEIPNLASRAGRYYLYLLQRYLFGLSETRSPVTASGESIWFIGYGVTAFCYRLFILTVIVLFLAKDYLFIGVILACWAITLQLILPLWRGLSFLFVSEKLSGNRLRAVVMAGGGLSLLSCGVLFIPVPHSTFAQGVVWVPEQSQVYAATEGFVINVLVPSGTKVKQGTLLVKMRSPVLAKRIKVLKAQQRILNIEKAKAMSGNPVQLNIISEEANAVEVELEQLYQQRAALMLRSKHSGIFVLPDDALLNEQYIQQGDLIGYITSPEHLIIRAVVSQADIALVRQHNKGIQIRLAEALNNVVDVDIIRMTPSSSKQLPSLALSVDGGGKVIMQKETDGDRSAQQAMFQIDLSLPKGLTVSGLGGRVYIRFDHGSEPLAEQWLRSGRQLLLSQL